MRHERNPREPGRLTPTDKVVTRRLEMSAAALDPRVIRRSIRLNLLAMAHLESRIRDPRTPVHVKDKLSKVALTLGPRLIAEIRALEAEQPGGNGGGDEAGGGKRPASLEGLLDESRKILSGGGAAVGQHGNGNDVPPAIAVEVDPVPWPAATARR